MHIPLPTKYNETKFLYSYYIVLSILFPLHHVYDFSSIESVVDNMSLWPPTFKIAFPTPFFIFFYFFILNN